MSGVTDPRSPATSGTEAATPGPAAERAPHEAGDGAGPAGRRPGVVGVVGAGAMGAGIAQVLVLAGHRVVLVDAVEGAAERAAGSVGDRLTRLVEKGLLAADDAAGARARLTTVARVADLPACEAVVEAVREDLGTKRGLVAELDRLQPGDTLLASNTSSLDLAEIAAAADRPERVLGLHFFNPPPLMRLVEVVHAETTGEWALERATALVRAWGKTPVRCTSTPGFIVNRVARPFYGEAQRMLQDGVADAATLDAALRGAGFRMGPLELTDLIGQDVNLAVGTSVWEQTGRDPRYAPTGLQEALVAAGHLGRKSGRGVYPYDADGRPERAAPDEARLAELVGGPVLTDPVARTLAMLVNEAVDLVRRGEASAEDVDTAMTLGTNYPTGPVAWGEEIGHDVVRARLAELDRAFPGGRYRPSPALGGGG